MKFPWITIKLHSIIKFPSKQHKTHEITNNHHSIPLITINSPSSHPCPSLSWPGPHPITVEAQLAPAMPLMPRSPDSCVPPELPGDGKFRIFRRQIVPRNGPCFMANCEITSRWIIFFKGNGWKQDFLGFHGLEVVNLWVWHCCLIAYGLGTDIHGFTPTKMYTNVINALKTSRHELTTLMEIGRLCCRGGVYIDYLTTLW